ncbi:uncharacterized protein BDR25DRAFT_300911 [Lindgomyces ingoldianus]|uniref:Uncharacterized protein n=1 Tax=Lindgomyces ingoldianus TaxID=673940 RepID=A0ACB6RA25_9PLEO|nr:uncharacterized protein BDR25DRAFT_300911 [Lindgomyces ingoldianus]KAF2476114.1 hypothetical protein BDR25DRAFT_300911 [Lindgomyces ingoldianus]
MLSQPHSALYWHPHVTHYNMEAFVFVSSGWLKTFFVLSALFWVAYRGYQVLSKPVEELVALLGLEVPVAPIVSLAGIRADGVLLHWKPPDARASVLKYVIRINGIDIGDVSPQETSVTIENLQPDHHYLIRIVTLNSANFQAPSIPIRLRTLPASSEQFYNTVPHKEADDGGDDDEYTPTPIIRPNKNLVDIIIPPVAAPPMAREHSNSTSRVRRVEIGRRNSPASQTADQARSAKEEADSMESIKQLTERLDSLRREIDDMEKQIKEEEDEFRASKVSLLEKRDEKKAALKEKEDASRDLRKEVASLERHNTAAQTRRTQQERVLRQKEAERKKLKDDMARWGREAGDLRAAVERIGKERTNLEATSEQKIQALKDKHADEIQTNKSLEEVIREKGTQIKALEEERKKLEEGEEGGDTQDGPDNAEKEEDRQWVLTLNALQQRYAQAWSLFTEAERASQEASNRLTFLQQRRLSQPQMFNNPPPPELVPGRRNSHRSRPVSMREPLTSAAPGGFVHSTAPPFNASISSVSPTFPNATPYFNINNGMALPPPRNNLNISSFPQAEMEILTGGAPMSPTAGALLPSGLFENDTGTTDTEDEDDPGPPQAPSNPSPNLRNVLPGLGAPGTLDQVQSPSSPVSIQSRSPSVFASPRDSAGQLAYYPTNENQTLVDSDKRSVRSTSSSFITNAQTTRFGNIFGLNRQRGKTFSDQGPPLGSLKAAQSQSLPRQEASGLDPIGSSRRRGSHSGGAWYDAFVRTSKTQPVESSHSPKHVATRKRPFNMFGSKGDPWLTAALGMDRPSSPRQDSSKSSDLNLLPRPSTESQTLFGWPVDKFGARGSPLGADWSTGNPTSWSRMPSRRPSMQHGSTVSLVHEDLLLGDTPDFPSTTRSPTQAPIGTRPQSSASYIPPGGPIPPTPPKQLNPAAPNFTSIFLKKKSDEDKAKKAAEKEAKKAEKEERERKIKAEKAEKAARKEKEKERLIASETAANDSGKDTSSPLAPRQSRDNRSMSTDYDDSNASPRESLERSISQTPSESQAHANAFGKESFIQKLSRKSSSSQFLQFGKGKTSLFSKKTNEAVTPDEAEEEGGLLVRSVDSPGNSPLIGTPKDKTSALSWSSIKRIGKRGDKTPSLHESITSEATGDEDEDEGISDGVMSTA